MSDYLIKCEECGTENVATRSNCRKCGKPLSYKTHNETINIIKPSNQKNSVASGLKVLAIIISIVGAIAGVALFLEDFLVGIGVILSMLLVVALLEGFAEIIQKLQNIESNTKR